MSTPLYEQLSKKFNDKREANPSFILMNELMRNYDNSFSMEKDSIQRFEITAQNSDNEVKTLKEIVAESWKKGRKNHLMIIGEGGIGKTISLLTLPDMFPDIEIPAIYVPLNMVNESNTNDRIGDYIKRWILDNNEDLYKQLLELVSQPWEDEPRLILLLDGFNEISTQDKESVNKAIKNWSDYAGIQVITSSRFYVYKKSSIDLNYSKIELQPLTEQTVEDYLTKVKVPIPKDGAVRRLVAFPLLLALYAKAELFRSQITDYTVFKPNSNVGSIIWNFLQSELISLFENDNDVKINILALEFIAPYIAWKMQRGSLFNIKESDFALWKNEAYQLLQTNSNDLRKFPQHIVIQLSDGLPIINCFENVLDKRLCLFVKNEDGMYRLMHQQFRDALAAMHLINSIYLNGNNRPEEWKSSVDHYVMKLVADLISEDEANRLWEQNRQTTPANDEATRNANDKATRNQLRLQGLLHDNDFSHLDFSGLDLSNISLYPYRSNNATINLPTQSEKMYKTKFSEISFSPEGHTNGVRTLAITPDGKRFISGSVDYTIRIWDLATGSPKGKPLQGHDGWVNTIAIIPDSNCIVSGSEDKTIRIWDLETGNQIGDPIQGHERSVNAIAVAITKDGKRIVSGSEDKTIRIWDLETGKQIRAIQGHEKSVNAIAITPDGKHIVSGSEDKTIRIWDLGTGKQIGDSIQGHEKSVNVIAITTDGTDDKRIVSGSEDKTIRIWDLETGEQIRVIQGHEKSVNAIAITTDGKRIVSGSEDKTIRIWDLEGKQIGDPIQGHEDCVNAVAITKDNERIISGSNDRTICFWNLETGEQIGEPIKGHNYAVRAISLTPDNKRIVVGFGDGTIRRWDLEGKQIGDPIQGHEDWVRTVTVNGKYIVSGSGDKTIRIWDLETGEQIRVIQGHEDQVNAVVVTSDGKQIVSSSQDKTIRRWDLETGQQIGDPIIHDDLVHAVAITSDGKCIVSGSDDKIIRLWDMKTGTQKPFEGHEDRVRAVVVTTDDKQQCECIVSGSDDRTIRIWDMETETRAQIGKPFVGHDSWVRAVDVTSDGKYIISGSGDRTVRIWDLETGTQIGEPIARHDSYVRAVAVTSDNKYVISGSWYGTIRITDITKIEEPHEVKTIRVHPLSFNGLDFSSADMSDELRDLLRQNGAIA